MLRVPFDVFQTGAQYPGSTPCKLFRRRKAKDKQRQCVSFSIRYLSEAGEQKCPRESLRGGWRNKKSLKTNTEANGSRTHPRRQRLATVLKTAEPTGTLSPPSFVELIARQIYHTHLDLSKESRAMDLFRKALEFSNSLCYNTRALESPRKEGEEPYGCRSQTRSRSPAQGG